MAQFMRTKRYENRQDEYTDEYVIDYIREDDGTIRMKVTEHPENPYDADVRKCHLYPSGNICVSKGKEPRSLEVAEAIAYYWMNGYSAYVRSGTFPDTGGRVQVPD